MNHPTSPSSQATVMVDMADFALADSAGKTNVVGSSLSVLDFDPAAGACSRFTLRVVVSLEQRLLPQDVALEVMLQDQAGELVELPGPGKPQPLRIGQLPTFDRVQRQAEKFYPVESLRSRQQIVVDFANGLPLSPARAYRWAVRLDNDEASDVHYPFAVAGPIPAPVFG